ncbi:MAG TPA: peptide deformylase [Ktedonobacteraceae bacterium]|nr:peptide deformylase [Ktedonobacteraceae bacterium]
MDKTDIISLPNKKLRERSKKVGIITQEVKTIIQGMKDATISWEDSREHEVGVALAAVQVGIHLRIIVVRNDFDNREDQTFSVFINPTITKYEGQIEEDYEGCLSVPDVYGKVPRYSKVRVKALDEEGREFRLTAEGFLARIFQHEIDHTNGIVFIDHIKDNKKAFFHLDSDGHLESINYDKDIKHSRILW